MDRIKSRGNEYCTHIWLGKYEAKNENIDLSSPDKRKDFMTLKYEEKKFYVDPREAIKKMKPRAPAAPSNSSVPRSQTVMPNMQIQRPGVSQAFSAGDISNAVPNAVKAFTKDPFQEIRKENGDGASFADFSSAFGNTGSAELSSQLPVTNASSSNSHKKPAPPPPDRYAALADLDNQLHQQADPPNTSASTPFWATPTVPPAVFATGVQNPFQPWTPQNPFQLVAGTAAAQQPCKTATNGSANPPSLPNGNIGAVYWPPSSSWGADSFSSKNAVIDNYNPWAQSFGSTTSANPFENGTSVGQSSSARNPFL
uniref:Arf-GAP domain and FG repeat-containing protein 2 n=1 Tax=Parasteatoda tepidariorum TaxID=114398 RepID=A0A2L2Y8T9_PARTP